MKRSLSVIALFVVMSLLLISCKSKTENNQESSDQTLETTTSSCKSDREIISEGIKDLNVFCEKEDHEAALKCYAEIYGATEKFRLDGIMNANTKEELDDAEKFAKESIDEIESIKKKCNCIALSEIKEIDDSIHHLYWGAQERELERTMDKLGIKPRWKN